MDEQINQTKPNLKSMWSLSHPGCFSPTAIAPITHWVGSGDGPRLCMDTVGKIRISGPANETPNLQSS